MAGMGWKQGGALVVGAGGGTYLGTMIANKVAKTGTGARDRIGISALVQFAGGFGLIKANMPNVGAGMIASGGVAATLYALTAGTAAKQGGDALLNGAAAILGLPSTDAATQAATSQINALPAATPATGTAPAGTQTGTPQAYTMARL